MRRSLGTVMVVVVVLMVLRKTSAQVTSETSTTTETTTPCTMPLCAFHLGCRHVPGTSGCSTRCACPDYNCDDVTCGPGQECVMQDVECPPDTTMCFPQPICFPPYDTTTINTTALTTTIPCPIPPCAVGCSPVPGSDGCFIGCTCPDDTCDTVTCGPDEECVMQCPPETPGCFPSPSCVPRSDTTTTSIPTTQPTTTTTTAILTTTCPWPMCGPVCRPVPGPEGCLICSCPNITCEEFNCGPYLECVMRNIGCLPYTNTCFHPFCVPPSDTTSATSTPTTSTPTSTPTTTTPTSTPTTNTQTTTFWCPQVTCIGGCQTIIDSNGCTNCVCPPSCEGYTCPDGEQCELLPTPCAASEYPCFPQPACVPVTETTVETTIPVETTTSCPMITCGPGCVPDTGCSACACPPTCQDFNCSKDEECVLQEVHCFTVPCFPQPTCVARNDSCSGTPNTKRCRRPTIRWFYNSSADECLKFLYYGCTPSPNTFLSRKSCERKCKSKDS